MKKEIIQQLYSAFEQAALEVDGVECWSARELCTLLGYSQWRNFVGVIDKAKTACELYTYPLCLLSGGSEWRPT